MFKFRVGRLIRGLFPEFSTQLESELLQQITGNDNIASIDFVIQILQTYNGETFLYPLIKKIISILNENDTRLDSIETIFTCTGVVRGAYGMSETYMKRKTVIETWLTDDDDKIRKFAECFTHTLDNLIKFEHKRSREIIELHDLHEIC